MKTYCLVEEYVDVENESFTNTVPYGIYDDLQIFIDEYTKEINKDTRIRKNSFNVKYHNNEITFYWRHNDYGYSATSFIFYNGIEINKKYGKNKI